jgi:putative MATE family efflux protein
MADLLRDPISPALVRLAVPIFIGLFVVGAQGAVNSYFVAGLGPEPLAAMSFAIPLTALLSSTFVGYGVGVTSTVSRSLGARRSDDATAFARSGLVVATAIALCMAWVGISLADGAYRLLAIEPRLLPYVKEYLQYWLLGLPLTAITLAGTAALRGAGETRSSGAILMLTAVLNLILDPLLIFGAADWSGWGVAGAAAASGISYTIGALVTLYTLQRRTRLLVGGAPTLRQLIASSHAILSVSAAAVATYVMHPALNTCVTALMAKHGTDAVSAWGVAVRVQIMVDVIPVAASAGLAPFVGQNWGAGQSARVVRSLMNVRRFLLIWGLSVWLGMAALSDPIAHLFGVDGSTLSRLRTTFQWLPLGAASHGMYLAVNSSLNAMGKPLSSAKLTLLRYVVLGVPLALVLDWAFGVRGLLLCTPTAAMIADFVAIRYFHRVMRQASPAIQQQESLLRPV